MTNFVKLFCAFVVVCFSLSVLRAQTSFLDPSFGEEGILLEQTPETNIWVYGMALNTDGSFYIGGSHQKDNLHTPFVRRYSSQGVLDVNYGIDGIRLIELPSGFGSIIDLAVQADGKLVAMATVTINGNIDIMVMRLEANGDLDATFANQGIFQFDLAGTAQYGERMILQNNGKIVVGGEDNYGESPLFLRLNTDGTLDQTFNNSGYLVQNIALSTSINSLAIDGNDRVVGVGRNYTGTGNDVLIIRLNWDGAWDNSFGSEGKVTIDLNGGEDFGYDVQIIDNENIILTGTTSTSEDNFGFVTRLLANGTIDNSFGNNGHYFIQQEGFYTSGQRLAIRQDGLIAVGGNYFDANLDVMNWYVRFLNNTGTVASEIGNNGQIQIALDGFQQPGDVLFDHNNNLLLSGFLVPNNSPSAYYELLVAKIAGAPVTNVTTAIANQAQFSFYPNPVTDQCQVKNQGEAMANVTFAIFDASGRKRELLTTNVAANEEISLPIETLESGNYFLQPVTANGPTFQALSFSILK